MLDYKVGDTVRRTKGAYKSMYVGDTDVVLEVDAKGVVLKKYGDGHSRRALSKCTTVFDADTAAELKAEALAAIAKYNEYLATYEPPFKPLVLE